MGEFETCPVCGHLVGDAQVAAAFHAREGVPQEIPMSGANDPGPMPERS